MRPLSLRLPNTGLLIAEARKIPARARPADFGLKPWAFCRKREAEVLKALPAKSRKLKARLAPKKNAQRVEEGNNRRAAAPFGDAVAGCSDSVGTGRSSSASQAKRPAANKPKTPNSQMGSRQLPAITARHPLYIGPKQNPTLAPMPTKPSARPLACGNKRATRAVAAGW